MVTDEFSNITWLKRYYGLTVNNCNLSSSPGHVDFLKTCTCLQYLNPFFVKYMQVEFETPDLRLLQSTLFCIL